MDRVERGNNTRLNIRYSTRNETGAYAYAHYYYWEGFCKNRCGLVRWVLEELFTWVEQHPAATN